LGWPQTNCRRWGMLPPVLTIQRAGMPDDASAVPTRPFLAVYVAWHPNFKTGADISLALFQHYRRDLYRNVAGGSGLPVIYRSQPPEGSAVPIDIDLDGAEATAIVLLVEENWSRDPAWAAWARRISGEADRTGLRETEKPDHSASLGDSITSSTRIKLSVHTAGVSCGLGEN
jgi:hypothetical protein